MVRVVVTRSKGRTNRIQERKCKELIMAEPSTATSCVHARSGTTGLDPLAHDTIEVPKHMYSRLMYTNPVCILTSSDPATGRRNAMTISWLTAISNRSKVLFSMNARRYTAEIVRDTNEFVLSVPVHGMEDMVTNIGGCSGREGDKFDALNIETCAVGWDACLDELASVEDNASTASGYIAQSTTPSSTYEHVISPSTKMDIASISPTDTTPTVSLAPSAYESDGKKGIQDDETTTTGRTAKAGRRKRSIESRDHIHDATRKKEKKNQKAKKNKVVPTGLAIPGCAAHLFCRVETVTETDGHLLLLCSIERAFVKEPYWDGKLFAPRSASTPPYLTFFGSKTFGLVSRASFEAS